MVVRGGTLHKGVGLSVFVDSSNFVKGASL